MTDFSSITGIAFTFMPHPSNEDAHMHLNNLYSDFIFDFDDIYVDTATKTELKPNAIEILTHKFISSIVDYASETTDKNKIWTLMNTAILKVATDDQPPVRFIDSELERTMKVAIQNSNDTIHVYIGLDHIHFDPQAPLTYLNWDVFSTTPFKKTAFPAPTAAAPLKAHDIVTAVATVLAAARTGSTMMATTAATITPASLTAANIAIAVATSIASPSRMMDMKSDPLSIMHPNHSDHQADDPNMKERFVHEADVPVTVVQYSQNGDTVYQEPECWTPARAPSHDAQHEQDTLVSNYSLPSSDVLNDQLQKNATHPSVENNKGSSDLQAEPTSTADIAAGALSMKLPNRNKNVDSDGTVQREPEGLTPVQAQLDIATAMNHHKRSHSGNQMCRDANGGAIDIVKRLFRADVTTEFEKLVFDVIQMSKIKLDSHRLALNLYKNTTFTKQISPLTKTFDLHAHNITYSQGGFFESNCVQNGMDRLLRNILQKCGMVEPSGILSISGSCTTPFATKVNFKVRFRLDVSNRDHVSGLEISRSPAAELFVFVVPTICLLLGYNITDVTLLSEKYKKLLLRNRWYDARIVQFNDNAIKVQLLEGQLHEMSHSKDGRIPPFPCQQVTSTRNIFGLKSLMERCSLFSISCTE